MINIIMQNNNIIAKGKVFKVFHFFRNEGKYFLENMSENLVNNMKNASNAFIFFEEHILSAHCCLI